MATRRGAKTGKRAGKAKNLRAKAIDAKHGKGVKGGSMARGAGGGEGKATFHDLSFVHNIDKASPVL